MSLMCKIGSKCCASKGMCIHEKMMMVIMIIAIPVVGHFILNWF